VDDSFAVIVIGGGHAGAEAAAAATSVLNAKGDGLASSRRVALLTMDPARIGSMSCNPAIGGLAKGQMVREIDALGGIMGLAADATGILFKVLNVSKGPAVRGPRAQCDKHAYARAVQRLLAERSTVEVLRGTVDDLLLSPDGAIRGVVSTGADGSQRSLGAGAVVLTTGTFMRAIMHTGESTSPGGRVGEGSAIGISGALRRLGFDLGRLKTGTPPRLRRDSIDWDALEPQFGDDPPTPFSALSPAALPAGRFPQLDQVDCRLTETTPEIHDLIRANLHRAPMYSGQIDAECGPRYCPSLEDKVVRFAERDRHHVFLEPESLETDEVYCNGISTSLPAEIQQEIVHRMPGCADAAILRFGYAVEYDMVWPHQIDATGETKRVPGLFLAGQINGTSGYEEAAGQGVVAGLNAARRVLSLEPLRLGREQAYIGVMMDDLVTKTPREPYRMFTSRAEHRLLLRGDNAEERLTPLGRDLGLVCDQRWALFQRRRRAGEAAMDAAVRGRVEGRPAIEWLRRPETTLEAFLCFLRESLGEPVERCVADRLLNDLRYEGYLARARIEIRRQEETERVVIPTALDPASISGLRREAVEVLRRFRPATLGQAGRLAGICPSDVTLIRLAVHRRRRAGHQQESDAGLEARP